MLEACDVALWERYDLAMLDLDGVVYIGPEAVENAPGHLKRAEDAGMHLAYVTNNASRPPASVAEHLRDLGIPAGDADVVTSAQAAARLVAETVPPGSTVFVIGGEGLVEALAEHELTAVRTIEQDPQAVVSGYHPDLLWKTVITGAILVARGLPWVASNRDMTIPTADGVGPGNGVLVQAVAGFAGREPTVAGKPEPALFAETQLRVGGQRPLVVGDRLDTDIEGAVNAGLDSLLVMTGVTGVDELVRADRRHRPTYISADLSGLGVPQPVPEARGARMTLGGWSATVTGDRLEVAGNGSVDDWWRVVPTAGWTHLDATGRQVDTSGLRQPGSVTPDHGRTQGQHAGEDGDKR